MRGTHEPSDRAGVEGPPGSSQGLTHSAPRCCAFTSSTPKPGCLGSHREPGSGQDRTGKQEWAVGIPRGCECGPGLCAWCKPPRRQSLRLDPTGPSSPHPHASGQLMGSHQSRCSEWPWCAGRGPCVLRSRALLRSPGHPRLAGTPFKPMAGVGGRGGAHSARGQKASQPHGRATFSDFALSRGKASLPHAQPVPSPRMCPWAAPDHRGPFPSHGCSGGASRRCAPGSRGSWASVWTWTRRDAPCPAHSTS